MEWIRVEDQPPPKDGKAFLGVIAVQVDIVWWEESEGTFKDYYYKQNLGSSLMYWMPLPNSPNNQL